MTSLWPHQHDALEWMERVAPSGGGMLHVPMGGGKTRIVLEHIARTRARRVLVLAPLAVVPVWAGEARKWCPGIRTAALSSGTTQQRAESVLDEGMTIVNYDAVWRGSLAARIQRIRWDAIVLDESHRIKSPRGRAARFCAELRRANPSASVWLLTGTPQPHGPLDWWAQLRACRPELVTRTFTEWRGRYAVIGRLGPWHVVGYRDLEHLGARIAPGVFRVDRISRPDVVVVDIPVELESAAMKIYRELEQYMVSELESGEVTINGALAKVLRLQQITSGAIPLDNGELQQVSSAKRDALRELIDDLGDEPVVVFGRFHADLDSAHAVAADLSTTSAELSGRVNQLAEWQAQDGPRVLAAQIQAGSVGVSMVRAAYAIFTSLSWGAGDWEQAVARLARPGQTRPVTIYRLVAKGTIDELIIKAIERKIDLAELLAELYARRSESAHNRG